LPPSSPPQSLQKPAVYDDPDATANANLSSRLPYLFACSRFAHYVKCMVRDKIGSTMTRAAVAELAAGMADGLCRWVAGDRRPRT
jgi:type VI secretion system protein ImpC